MRVLPAFAPVPGFLAIAVVIAASCGRGDRSTPVPSFGACTPPARPAAAAVTLEPVWAGVTFDQPTDIVQGPDKRFYVVEQGGKIKVLPASSVAGGAGAPTVALDITSRIVSGGEAGLLGFAFDPKFAQNGFAYLYYTANLKPATPAVVFQDVLVRMSSKDGGATFDPATTKVLLSIDDPFANHNGGHLAFGPDGFLYLGIGDGGSEGDPNKNGQNTNVLFGKMLRIDPSSGDPYAIPETNPFAHGGGRPEIFAYGLRNPWKFSFDKATGELWAADVGQDKFEEIDRLAVGGNYGWSVREGRHCYNAATCATDGLIDPISEYSRIDGVCVIGGYVYRGTKIPALSGKFVYGDFGAGNIWSTDPGQPEGDPIVTDSNMRISTFGQDADGEIYVADYVTGTIHRLAAGPAAPPPAPAPSSADASTTTSNLLSATGCLDPKSSAAPSDAIAYDVNSPLWSDGAAKARWVFLPKDAKIGVGPDGDFDLPPASVAVKTFSIDGKKIETRLFARYADGAWAGWSYEWNDDQTDATLLEDAKTKDLGSGRSWYFPSRSQCLTCHTPVAGFTLGLEARQLAGRPGVLERFAPVLAAPVAQAAFPPLRAADALGGSPEEHARGYLHANCSFCHRAGSGVGASTLDLRIDRSLADSKTCNAAPQGGDLGVAGAKIVTPGDPSKSVLALRMRSLADTRMPPLATHVVDEVGASAVETWIRGLGGCP